MAIVNLRFLDAGIAKLKPEGETSVSNKVLRRAMGTKSVTRLGIITVICIGLMLLNGALGIGAVAGLVIFQLLFVVNVGPHRHVAGHPMREMFILASGTIKIGEHRGVVHVAGLDDRPRRRLDHAARRRRSSSASAC